VSRFAPAFDGLTGQPAAVRLLGTALESGRLPHALLLHGPAGVGKGTAARMLAAAILCQGETTRPCRACAACGRLSRGDTWDLVELSPDGSFIKIEQVRELTETMYTGIQRGVAIIDPADAMNPQAANGLLKTLEEPPAGWTLILVAARPEALPATIRSRCQAVRFARLSEGDTRAVLAAHAAADQVTALAAFADGAPGQALAAGLEPDELAAEFAEAAGCLTPATFGSPSRIFAAAESWGRDADRTRRFIAWARLWTSHQLHRQTGADAGAALPGMQPTDMSAARLAAFQNRLEAAAQGMDRNLNRPVLIEELLFTLGESGGGAPC